MRVLLAPLQRSGLARAFPARRALTVSSLSGECPARVNQQTRRLRPRLTCPPQSARLTTRSVLFVDAAQTSRDKFDCCPHATAGFTLRALDGYGLRGLLPARRRSRLRSGSCPSALPASFRHRLATGPSRLATLNLHQVGRGLSPPSCRTWRRTTKKEAPGITPEPPRQLRDVESSAVTASAA
jgi:hypothetical protein